MKIVDTNHILANRALPLMLYEGTETFYLCGFKPPSDIGSHPAMTIDRTGVCVGGLCPA